MPRFRKIYFIAQLLCKKMLHRSSFCCNKCSTMFWQITKARPAPTLSGLRLKLGMKKLNAIEIILSWLAPTYLNTI